MNKATEIHNKGWAAAPQLANPQRSALYTALQQEYLQATYVYVSYVRVVGLRGLHFQELVKMRFHLINRIPLLAKVAIQTGTSL